ncbi:DUF6959 family protein [Rhizobium leguminosarum]|jgi:hypothetical protein|uniref:DUF6959 family protein n=2 Tax=Rhizobium leguminosarum TaxID=384 RepID=UPI001C90DB84|nr:hypothetical protein [Rhizobium leguminosarum]MBY2914313.1 hypothetical protein [Rhizobium leguminosarum]MBY2919853.1 hypothetical protein [Rhizobium leguminosarum]MBY2966071.1 hypothetical protein [Rhizobium leguminosarum]MBY2969852.1 hypothetical protein [Rhizobium leguminosarum]MBY2977225.1 hypothetical protein [Rhizobium leguminosarum]
MRSEDVEIFSDMTNAAVMRHPGRKFPGILIQGDTLYTLCREADAACEKVGRGRPGYEDLNDLRNALWFYLNHYKSTLHEHGIGLPFSEDRPFE